MVKSQLHTNSLKTSAPPFLNVAWHSMAQHGTVWLGLAQRARPPG